MLLRLVRHTELVEAFLLFYIMNKGNNLEKVNFAENILKNEAKVGLGLNLTNKGAENTSDKVVF